MAQLSGQIILSNVTATQFSNVVLYVVALKADPDNTNPIWIGDDGTGNVSSTTGFSLQPGETVVVAVNGNLNILYGIAETNNEVVCWLSVDR